MPLRGIRAKCSYKNPIYGHLLIFVLLWVSLGSVADTFLRPYPTNHWKSVIFSDKSGYYAYLPATFIYDWHGESLPDSICEKVGYGFSIEPNGKIKNKYPAGVAYFEAPFFLFTYINARVEGKQVTGFESEFHQSVAYSTLFWTLIGLFFLAEAFRKISGSFWLGWFISLAYLFSTNLLYYSIKAPGFSHPFSFFLFSALLYALPYTIKKISTLRWIAIGFLIGLIFSVRTLNILFAFLYIFGIIWSRKNAWQQLWTEKKGVLWGIFFSLLPLIPQAIYWKYAFGAYLTNSYRGEGFTALLSPDFSATLVSVNNGLLLYTPIWIATVLFLFFSLRKKIGIMPYSILIIIALQIYLCSSWSTPFFGCSFGHRVFVDILPFAALATLIFLKFYVVEQPKFIHKGPILFGVLLAFSVCIVYTQTLAIHFDTCWPLDFYDYPAFRRILLEK